MLSQAEQRRICAERERTGWGPRLIAALVGRPHSTVHATLKRNGCSRRPAPAREAVVRFEWPCPGDLVQVDTKRFARFSSPGHAVTGDRTSSGAAKRARVGYEIAHSAIDDHSRLAYTELHPDERGPTVVGFVTRALAFFAAHGIEVRRLQTDNAWTYTHNRELAELLAGQGIQHRLIPPRTPKRNGKVCVLASGAVRLGGEAPRARALPHWLNHYNERRRHSSIGNQPPISRVRNLPGQDS